MSSDVDAVQHGGKHYKTAYQHWNLLPAIGFGLEYYLGCATKYVVRHRSKNGRQDVEKAIHFMQKAVELLREGLVPPQRVPMALGQGILAEVQHFAKQNGVERGTREYRFLKHALLGRTVEDYALAIEAAEAILDEYPAHDAAPAQAMPTLRQPFRPTPGGQFGQEGWWGDGTTLLKCNSCGVYFRMDEHDNPHEKHVCAGAEPSYAYVNQDR
jgi:hypothetical protein